MVVGELDVPDLHIIATVFMEKIRGVKKVVIPYVAHMPNLEAF